MVLGITHAEFGALRLSNFLSADQIAPLDEWEFMERTWVGEAAGFSQWLRLAEEPDELRSLALDFTSFPPAASDLVLERLGTALRPGMNLEQLRDVLGEPASEIRFVAGRVTWEYAVTEPAAYTLSCTVRDDVGLSYLVVTSPLDAV